MKYSLRHLIPLFCAGALVASATPTEPGAWRWRMVRTSDTTQAESKAEPTKAPREKVTFLGVETSPLPAALAAQLGLPKDMGLVVTRLADNSPAVGVLQEHDVLTKLGDQLLIDSRQLSVLVRSKKPGDEVKLTIYRGGKEQVVTAKLGERELPRMFGVRPLNHGNGFQFEFGEGFDLERLRELPGIAREELKDVFRIIGDERRNWFNGPRVHVFRRQGGANSTVLNLAEGNFVFSDNEGSVEVNASDGKRQLTVKDVSGQVIFDGPIDTDEQREQLPPEVKARLKKLEGTAIEFEANEELQQEGARLTPSTKSRINHKPREPRPLPLRGSSRPF